MDFSTSPSTKTKSSGLNPVFWLVLMAFAGYSWLIIHNVNACAGGSDSSGYMNHAQLLANGRVHATERTITGVEYQNLHSYLYTPLGLKPAPLFSGLVPTYPTGISLMIMAVSPVMGWNHAGDAVIVLHSLAGIILIFLLAQAMGLGMRYSTLALVILATSPLYLTYSVQLMSDLPAMVWATLAVLAAWKSSKSQTKRSESGWSLACGFAVSVAVLIRPTNVLIFIPVLFALGLSPKRIFTCGAGGIPGAVFFALHSSAAYGNIGTTGYGDAWALFESTYGKITLLHYMHWIPIVFSPIAALAVGLIFLIKKSTRLSLVLLSWILVYLGFYCFYSCTHETWWYLRFILPAGPALIVGGLIVLRTVLTLVGFKQYPSTYQRLAYITVAAVIAVSSSLWTKKLNALTAGRGESVYPKTAQWLRDNVPTNAVILAMQESGALFYYTQFTIIRWDELDKQLTNQIVLNTTAQNRPIYAALFNWEVDDALHKHFPGNWIKCETLKDTTIWKRQSQ